MGAESHKGKFFYIAVVSLVMAAVLGWLIFATNYEPANCFDGKMNNNEVGIDCGGGCQYLCPFQTVDPTILFSRSIETTSDVYNAVAYVENSNFNAGVKSADYVFKLYDENNELIAERVGNTFIPAGRISPIFEGTITTESRKPAKTFFEFTGEQHWTEASALDEVPLIAKNKILTNADSKPQITARLENTSIFEFRDIEVVVVVIVVVSDRGSSNSSSTS